MRNQISTLPSVRPLPIDELCGWLCDLAPVLFAPADMNDAVRLVPGEEKPGVSWIPLALLMWMLNSPPL